MSTPTDEPGAIKRAVMTISNVVLERLRMARTARTALPAPKLPQLPPGVRPDGATIAMDSGAITQWGGGYGCFPMFPGYPALAQLEQLSEYRAPVTTLAKEMTRKWIKLTTRGVQQATDENTKTKLPLIEQRMRELNVQDLFRRCAEVDGYFGRSQLYIRLRGNDDDETPLLYEPETIPKGSLIGFQVIEPLWTTPQFYNATDPRLPSFYRPDKWYVLGHSVHRTRILTFVSHPVSDMLKPSYNFGGMSISQLMQPYVQDWFSARDHVAALLKNFSCNVLKTNMQATLQGDTDSSFQARAELFNQVRDNNGVLILDKDSEEFMNVATPLSGIHELKAQAQENMCAPSHIPAVKLTGVTPSGLNASSDGEIRVWYDHVHSAQEVDFRPHLTTVLRIIQLDLFGEIDEAIDFDFNPLYEPSDKELADMRKSDSDRDCAYVAAGIVSPDEVRTRLANDPQSGYTTLTGEAPTPELDDTEENTEEKDDGKAKRVGSETD